jgi:hypothetical protein
MATDELFSVGDKIEFMHVSDSDMLDGKIIEIHTEPNQSKWLKIEGIDSGDSDEAADGW